MKEWIKDNIVFIVIVAIILVAGILIYSGASSEGALEWYRTPLKELSLGDILVIVLLHAFINK